MNRLRCLVAGLCLAALSNDLPAAERAAEGNGDMLCGPLCVTYLLRAFGRPADVDLIAAEADWGRGGATMESLVASLRRRGLSVMPLKVPAGIPFRTAVPALLHSRGTDGAGGHYVVLLPSGAEALTLWDPADGVTSVSAREFAAAHSGAVALVTVGPVPAAAIEPIRSDSTVKTAWWCVFPVALAGCVFVAARLRGPRPWVASAT